MNNLYEALEICLQDIEKGSDLESVLFRYPDLADELRPLLEASAGARSMAVPAPSAEVVRRNRAKVLQRAAQMRESKVKSSQRVWFASLRRIAVTLAVVAVLFVSGTSLVSASSNTLPGDNLYSVKRTWEGLRLFFTFNPLEREALEREHENERLHEVQELLAGGRAEQADFNGIVMSQNGNEWVVANLRVLISDQTEFGDQGLITVGSPVRIRGVTRADGTILAERIRLLSSDEIVPDADDGHESGNGNENNSGPGSGDDGPSVEETETSEPENDNSGNGNDSGTNDNLNDNENNNSNDNSGSNDSGGDNDNSGNDNSNENNNESGGNENGNDSGGEENQNNDNSNDSGGVDSSGSGGGSGGAGED